MTTLLGLSEEEEERIARMIRSFTDSIWPYTGKDVEDNFDHDDDEDCSTEDYSEGKEMKTPNQKSNNRSKVDGIKTKVTVTHNCPNSEKEHESSHTTQETKKKKKRAKLPCNLSNCVQVLKNHRYFIAETEFGKADDWIVPSKQAEYEAQIVSDTLLNRLGRKFVKHRDFGRVELLRRLDNVNGSSNADNDGRSFRSSNSIVAKRNEERIQRASDELMSIGFNVRDVHPGNGRAFQFVRKLHYYFDD